MVGGMNSEHRTEQWVEEGSEDEEQNCELRRMELKKHSTGYDAASFRWLYYFSILSSRYRVKVPHFFLFLLLLSPTNEP